MAPMSSIINAISMKGRTGMKNRGIYKDNGDLSAKGIVLTVILSVTLALFLDLCCNLIRTFRIEENAYQSYLTTLSSVIGKTV